VFPVQRLALLGALAVLLFGVAEAHAGNYVLLGGEDWCYEAPGVAHDDHACERFAPTFAWAYWPSTDNTQHSEAVLSVEDFRNLVGRLLPAPRSRPVPRRGMLRTGSSGRAWAEFARARWDFATAEELRAPVDLDVPGHKHTLRREAAGLDPERVLAVSGLAKVVDVDAVWGRHAVDERLADDGDVRGGLHE
jgi:hypothetical protein